MDAMFEVPESNIVAVKVDHDVILGKKPVEYVRSPKVETKVPSSEEGLEGEVADEGKAKNYA